MHPAIATRPSTHGTRPGFTLVEMLVVLTLILILAGIAVTFAPSLQNQQKTTRAADLLQGWLLLAKQRAAHDRVPTGLRLVRDPGAPLGNPNYVRSLQFVQQPEELRIAPPYQMRITSPPDSVPAAPPPGWTMPAATATVVVPPPGMGMAPPMTFFDFYGGNTAAEQHLWIVQPGDYVEFEQVRTRVRAVLTHLPSTPGPPIARTTLELWSSPLPPGTPSPKMSNGYKIIRQPRVLGGEAPLQLPADTVIDFTPITPAVPPSTPAGPPLSTVPGYMASPGVFYDEILFSPSGEVIGQGTGNHTVVLWVRDVTLDSPFEGTPVLVTVYVRTGLVAAHPVAPGSDPYRFTRDGGSSGI